jgi:hypothetical protein
MVDLGTTLGSVGWKVGYWAIIIVGGLVFLGFVTLVTWLYFNAKAYKRFKVLIFKRNKEGSITFCGIAKGRIKKNKLKKYVLHIKPYNIELGETKDNADELDIPSIPNEQSGGEVIFLEKLGKRKYTLVKPIDLGTRLTAQVMEEDIAEAVRIYDINAKYYTSQDWKAWIAPTVFIIMAVLIVIMIAILINKFEVLREVSANLVEAAKIVKEGALRNSGVAVG